MALTKAAVEQFKFNPDGPVKQILWDTDPAGFGVRAYGNGKKSWVVAYRVGRGRGARQRLIVLESTDKTTLSAARAQAKDYQATARQGKDPFEHVYHEDHRPTVAALAERYMKEHAAPRKAPRSVRNDRYTWDRYILPRMGRKVVALLATGERAMQDGRAADVLELTFSGVGLTPENKYEVMVDVDAPRRRVELLRPGGRCRAPFHPAVEGLAARRRPHAGRRSRPQRTGLEAGGVRATAAGCVHAPGFGDGGVTVEPWTTART